MLRQPDAAERVAERVAGDDVPYRRRTTAAAATLSGRSRVATFAARSAWSCARERAWRTTSPTNLTRPTRLTCPACSTVPTSPDRRRPRVPQGCFFLFKVWRGRWRRAVLDPACEVVVHRALHVVGRDAAARP